MDILDKPWWFSYKTMVIFHSYVTETWMNKPWFINPGWTWSSLGLTNMLFHYHGGLLKHGGFFTGFLGLKIWSISDGKNGMVSSSKLPWTPSHWKSPEFPKTYPRIPPVQMPNSILISWVHGSLWSNKTLAVFIGLFLCRSIIRHRHIYWHPIHPIYLGKW